MAEATCVTEFLSNLTKRFSALSPWALLVIPIQISFAGTKVERGDYRLWYCIKERTRQLKWRLMADLHERLGNKLQKRSRNSDTLVSHFIIK